ncbi:DUF1585 domain-containing protein [Verrucomicrobium spinosum]|uniref:DUF1585 domain-containing protein n=1 Tax=Verrucomicrobium spinosum TaxID=2736 RepID=UPI00210A7DCA|nr:DUF1585 domain-containing protein [Verrucomicrobium spinosum]
MRQLPSQDRPHRLRSGKLRRRRSLAHGRQLHGDGCQWPSRPQDRKTWTIDPAAKLHNGPAFKDYQELRDIIATRADDFARGYSSALIEYALGRPCGFSDEPLVNAMITQARGKNLAAREFIHALVLSKAFHTK